MANREQLETVNLLREAVTLLREIADAARQTNEQLQESNDLLEGIQSYLFFASPDNDAVGDGDSEEAADE